MTQKRSAALPKLRPFAACQGTLGQIRLGFDRPSSIQRPWSQIEATGHLLKALPGKPDLMKCF
jgi:hypothetical protein